MQTAASKDKIRRRPGQEKDADDPDYENITLARNREQPKGSQPAPKQASAQPLSPGDTTQVPAWLHRAIMSLYIFLALVFLLCIMLAALILVKCESLFFMLGCVGGGDTSVFTSFSAHSPPTLSQLPWSRAKSFQAFPALS
ncbi:mast cell-expressed membrane protein 1 [Thomomys bottae]